MKLEVQDLAFSFGKGKRSIKDVSFELEPGEVLCLLGPNGAGKTTLLRCLTGGLQPSGGRMLLGGDDTTGLPPRDLAQRMAYVPQASQPAFGHKLREMVLMGRSPHMGRFDVPGPADHERAEAALARLGIAHLADRSFAAVSGGERQLCLLARALAQEARILVLDEPAASLDFGNQIKLLEVISELSRDGFGILMVTHHPDHALQVGNRFLALKAGVIHAAGTVSRMTEPGYLTDLYGADIEVIRDPGGRTACLPILEPA
ncbi:MAG: ABC transporter ATP-binding protein [Tropicimonas sp.]|uniref:ABC transporter ATP-binding protein n=1 Tax=Tropicimonas sp. TaxID=2067044 RepID=UPI003A84AF50